MLPVRPRIGRHSCRRWSSSSSSRSDTMPASKAEQVLEVIKALLETVPGAVVERNSALPEKIPGGGLIVLRDGDPGEPEQALGGFGNAYYQHAVEIEVYVEEGDAAARDAA